MRRQHRPFDLTGERAIELLDRRWDYDREALRRWYAARGEEVDWGRWPSQTDMVTWLLDERERETKRAWWNGVIYGATAIIIILVIGFGVGPMT